MFDNPKGFTPGWYIAAFQAFEGALHLLSRRINLNLDGFFKVIHSGRVNHFLFDNPKDITPGWYIAAFQAFERLCTFFHEELI